MGVSPAGENVKFTHKLIAKYPAIPFIAPFATFILMLASKQILPLPITWLYATQALIVVGVVLLTAPRVASPSRAYASIAVGVLVFVVWIAPDLLWPSYREHWLFKNFLTGAAVSSLPVGMRLNASFLTFRIFSTAVLVPIVEELFWRGWLMRYLINADFRKVPLGTYSAASYWLTAALFATEHGAFWDVGLVAGLIYNGWMVRTRNLSDCMLAHGVTNLCLALFVVLGGHWQYWL
jgi:CAAX prenyl protease-like protein